MNEPCNTLPIINIANEGLQKGVVREDMQLTAWDCIQDCNPESCPIGSRCTYKIQSEGKCSLQTEYLQTFVNMVFRTYRFLDESDMHRVGMHLIPLYSQLCRMKIVEKSISGVCYEDAKGITRVHPIFKEIRDTMKTISFMWKDIGVNQGPNPELPGSVLGRDGFGDPNHYAEISKNSDNKRDVIR